VYAHGRHIAGDGSSLLIADLGYRRSVEVATRRAKALTPDMSSIRIRKARASPAAQIKHQARPASEAWQNVARDDRHLYPYIMVNVRRLLMEITARLSSKGQVTVPRAVREALSLEEGDRLVFRVEGDHAILARTADLLALAGSVSVPAAKRGAPWTKVLAETRQTRAAKHG
jgi:antitoxin PrlF